MSVHAVASNGWRWHQQLPWETRIVSVIDKNVDGALWPLIEAFPPIDLSAETLIGFRAAMVQLSVLPDASTHSDVRVEELKIAGSGDAAASIRCLLLTPAHGAAAAALLHIHGGGFVMGNPEMDVARNIELVRATGCAILSVDYRLAPEQPHPAGLEDCHAALVWLAANAQALGISSGRIGVIGESAGGGLAASLALLARDRRSVALACQVLIYPMLVPPAQAIDDPHTGRYIWTRASNGFAWSAYLGGAAPDPATLAGLATDLVGLPAAFIAVGAVDLFVHDDIAYAGRLLKAGCSVEAHVYPGAIHGFDRMGDAAVSVRYTRDLVDFLVRELRSPQSPGG
jgi:acetyl esterase/lipase